MRKEEIETPAKRIQILSIKLVREGSMLFKTRRISSTSEAAGIGRQFLEELDREQVVVCCLDIKNQPTSVNVVSVGTLNASLIHPEKYSKRQS